MNEFLFVFAIALFTGILTYLGAPLAERADLPHSVVSAALQFAAGILTAIVAFTLMPRALEVASPLVIVPAFFIGGALFVLMEYLSARASSTSPAAHAVTYSLGLYLGVLADMLIDGVVIGIGSSLTFAAGLLLALGVAVSSLPLAFVTIATAKRQGIAPERRRMLGLLFIATIVVGALLGFWLVGGQSPQIQLTLIALASGFLFTMVTQTMIPEANREAEMSYSGIFYIGGLSLFALLTLYAR